MLKLQEALDLLGRVDPVGNRAKAAWPRIVLVLFETDVCVCRAHPFFTGMLQMRLLVHALRLVIARGLRHARLRQQRRCGSKCTVLAEAASIRGAAVVAGRLRNLPELLLLLLQFEPQFPDLDLFELILRQGLLQLVSVMQPLVKHCSDETSMLRQVLDDFLLC